MKLTVILPLCAAAAVATATAIAAEPSARTDRQPTADNTTPKPLVLRLTGTPGQRGQHFWQNTATTATGKPFYFSGPAYTADNKFDWRVREDPAKKFTKIELVITGGAKPYRMTLQGRPADFAATGFAGTLGTAKEAIGNAQVEYPVYPAIGSYTAQLEGTTAQDVVKSNELSFEVRSRWVFWYDSTETPQDKGAPSAYLQVLAKLTPGQASTEANSPAEALLQTCNWMTAWGYQTVSGELSSNDHGGPWLSQFNADGDRGTYGYISIGDETAASSGFDDVDVLGIGAGQLTPVPALYLPEVKVTLNHCRSGDNSCGHHDTPPKDPWPLIANGDIDHQKGPRLIDTFAHLGHGAGSGKVSGSTGVYAASNVWVAQPWGLTTRPDLIKADAKKSADAEILTPVAQAEIQQKFQAWLQQNPNATPAQKQKALATITKNVWTQIYNKTLQSLHKSAVKQMSDAKTEMWTTIKPLLPASYDDFAANHGGTIAGWEAWLATQAKLVVTPAKYPYVNPDGVAVKLTAMYVPGKNEIVSQSYQ